jgi:hypothetical protein
VDLENKIIAVIGSGMKLEGMKHILKFLNLHKVLPLPGSSAIQMIPELAAKAKELHCYQRKPAWVMPRRQYKVPEFVKWIFANIPFVLLIFRWLIFLSHELVFPAFLHDSWMSRLCELDI